MGGKDHVIAGSAKNKVPRPRAGGPGRGDQEGRSACARDGARQRHRVAVTTTGTVGQRSEVMKALVWHGTKDVRVEEVPDPKIEKPTDAIMRITSTAMCGADLHLYEVLGPFLEARATSSATSRWASSRRSAPEAAAPAAGRPGGDPVQHLLRALLDVQRPDGNRSARRRRCTSRTPAPRCSATRSCTGRCLAARRNTCGCRWRSTAPSRCPGPPDERFLYLSDILPTAWQAVEYADIPAGGTWPSPASGRSGSSAADSQAPGAPGDRRQLRPRAAGGRGGTASRWSTPGRSTTSPRCAS